MKKKQYLFIQILCVYIYIYIQTYIHTYIHILIIHGFESTFWYGSACGFSVWIGLRFLTRSLVYIYIHICICTSVSRCVCINKTLCVYMYRINVSTICRLCRFSATCCASCTTSMAPRRSGSRWFRWSGSGRWWIKGEACPHAPCMVYLPTEKVILQNKCW